MTPISSICRWISTRIANCGGKESKPVASADRAYRPVMMRDGRVPWEPRMKIDQRTSEPNGSHLSLGVPISFALCIAVLKIQSPVSLKD